MLKWRREEKNNNKKVGNEMKSTRQMRARVFFWLFLCCSLDGVRLESVAWLLLPVFWFVVRDHGFSLLRFSFFPVHENTLVKGTGRKREEKGGGQKSQKTAAQQHSKVQKLFSVQRSVFKFENFFFGDPKRVMVSAGNINRQAEQQQFNNATNEETSREVREKRGIGEREREKA